jgi:hypothetical protein
MRQRLLPRVPPARDVHVTPCVGHHHPTVLGVTAASWLASSCGFVVILRHRTAVAFSNCNHVLLFDNATSEFNAKIALGSATCSLTCEDTGRLFGAAGCNRRRHGHHYALASGECGCSARHDQSCRCDGGVLRCVQRRVGCECSCKFENAWQ